MSSYQHKSSQNQFQPILYLKKLRHLQGLYNLYEWTVCTFSLKGCNMADDLTVILQFYMKHHLDQRVLPERD